MNYENIKEILHSFHSKQSNETIKDEDTTPPLRKYENHIRIEDIIKDIVREEKEKPDNDDPFYIVDIGQITHAYQEWKRLLPYIDVYYAVKCNTDPLLLKVLASLGSNFDTASSNEIEQILRITNNDPTRILYANPCKAPSHLRYARSVGVKRMTFDCKEELYKIRENHPEAELILRIGVDDSSSLCKFNKKFGFVMKEEKDVEEIFQLSRSLHLRIIGVSFHVGSGCTTALPYYTALRDCRTVYDIYNRVFSFSSPSSNEPFIIDIGGGFPGKNTKTVRFEEIVSSIHHGIGDYFQNELKEGKIKCIAEPGRYIACDSHTLVLTVIGKKKTENLINYTLNDGVYGSFNCIYYDHQKPVLRRLSTDVNSDVNTDTDDNTKKSRFFGPTCDSLDVIYENIDFPELEIGHRLYVTNFGAYTRSSSSCGFNGFSVENIHYIIGDGV